MQQSSRPVTSGQRSVHPGLPQLLRRHRDSTWRKPPQAVDQPALERLATQLASDDRPLILDSFCGTGHSSAALAARHGEALVIGVDKSADRLRRSPPLPANCLLLQAHCEAVWRFLAERGARLQAHYLLYPNPWPKSAHLARRVHGHPAFPLLVHLGGIIELRSNWRVYVEEFGVALHLLGITSRIAVLGTDEAPLTRFEAKYRDSGHELWVLRGRLRAASATTAQEGDTV
jgi:tRNA G46 methylase TrmB